MLRFLTAAVVALAALFSLEGAPALAQKVTKELPLDRVKRPLPDLVIERIKVDDDDIKVKVKNIGTADSSASKLQVIVLVGRARRVFVADIPALRVGMDRNVKVETGDFRADRKGTRVIAIADFTNVMLEGNEKNNRLEKLVD